MRNQENEQKKALVENNTGLYKIIFKTIPMLYVYYTYNTLNKNYLIYFVPWLKNT